MTRVTTGQPPAATSSIQPILSGRKRAPALGTPTLLDGLNGCAIDQVIFGHSDARPFVKTRAVTTPGRLLRFAGQPKIPASTGYQTYKLPLPDGGSRDIRFTDGDPDFPGATWIEQQNLQGINFALYSRNASKVELCLLNSPQDSHEAVRIPLKRSGDTWHGFSPDLQPGQIYGYRVYGPYQPREGHRFNDSKLLVDPAAKAIERPIEKWDTSLTGYLPSRNPNDPAEKSTLDSAAHSPLGVVIRNDFDWQGDQHPKTPWQDTVIYEAHVKGMTALHPKVPANLRGTYAGLATEPVIKHLKDLGVTAVEVLPVQFSPDDQKDKGRTNYWRYNTLGYYAPETDYASDRSQPDGPVKEFKSMVQAMHRNGLEVFMDVVYNHTAEGNEFGPTLAMRGVDNQAYYRLVKGEKQYYQDYTGCGNTLDTNDPSALNLILDSLRYWVTEMHVDGFRFDLASALARDPSGNIPANMLDHPLFKAIQADPVLSKVKLIAEPWDASGDGYRVGGFPKGWSEWNGKYRDDMRKFWRGDGNMLGAFASRLAGSSDVYNGRGPLASVNFITAHDGYTMNDLVSYEEKHNWANGENNRDGENNNHSRNFGVEGPTSNPAINLRRKRQMKNFWATLLLSQGVPMILHGDELGRTQSGNNNTYCQDNETSWMHWNQTDQELLNFAKLVGQIRKAHPAFRRSAFMGPDDVTWLRPDAQPMKSADWSTGYARSIGVLYNGNSSALPQKDDHFLLLANASENELLFKLPEHPDGRQWQLVFDTVETQSRSGRTVDAGTQYRLAPGSMALLSMPNPAKQQAKPLLKLV